MPARIRGSLYFGINDDEKQKSIHPVDYFELAKSKKSEINTNKFVRRSVTELRNLVSSGKLNNQPIMVEHDTYTNNRGNVPKHGVIGEIVRYWVNPDNPLELKFEANVRNEAKHLLEKKKFVSLNFKVLMDGKIDVQELSLTDDPFDSRCTYDVVYSVNSKKSTGLAFNSVGEIVEIFEYKSNENSKLNHREYINLDHMKIKSVNSMQQNQQNDDGEGDLPMGDVNYNDVNQMDVSTPNTGGNGGGFQNQQTGFTPQRTRKSGGSGPFQFGNRRNGQIQNQQQQSQRFPQQRGDGGQFTNQKNQQQQQQFPQQRRSPGRKKMPNNNTQGRGRGRGRRTTNNMMMRGNGNGYVNGNGNGNGGQNEYYSKYVELKKSIEDGAMNYLTENESYYKKFLEPIFSNNPNMRESEYDDVMQTIKERRSGQIGSKSRHDRTLNILLKTLEGQVDDYKNETHYGQKVRKTNGGGKQFAYGGGSNNNNNQGRPQQQKQQFSQQPQQYTGNSNINHGNQQYLNEMEQPIFRFSNNKMNVGNHEITAMHNKSDRFFREESDVKDQGGLHFMKGIVALASRNSKYSDPSYGKIRKNDETQYGDLKEDDFSFTSRKKGFNKFSFV